MLSLFNRRLYGLHGVTLGITVLHGATQGYAQEYTRPYTQTAKITRLHMAIQGYNFRTAICDRILENHPYGHILHIKYLVLKSSLKILFLDHL